MGPGAFGYLAFGAALVVLFALIFKYYYAKNRRAKVEEAKYRMLDDDDERPDAR
ncbi:MAG: CcoQ/FixQ family Cbb3-type cytochrome c oxidase assembly chaperone [Anaeromyxobacteraceae bacterium]|jgi:cbb3-type cytochrome oxidase subunit 3